MGGADGCHRRRRTTAAMGTSLNRKGTPMMTATSKLPRDTRTVRFDPDLAAALEGLLAPHSGKALERAQGAILQVRRSGFTGGFGDMVDKYREAIAAAVASKG